MLRCRDATSQKTFQGTDYKAWTGIFFTHEKSCNFFSACPIWKIFSPLNSCCHFTPHRLVFVPKFSNLYFHLQYLLSSLLTTLSVSIHGFSFKWKSMLYLITYILDSLNLQSPGWSMADSWSRQASKWMARSAHQHNSPFIQHWVPSLTDSQSSQQTCTIHQFLDSRFIWILWTKA